MEIGHTRVFHILHLVCMTGFGALSDCTAVLGFVQAFEGCSVRQGTWQHQLQDRQSFAGKDPTRAAEAHLLQPTRLCPVEEAAISSSKPVSVHQGLG